MRLAIVAAHRRAAEYARRTVTLSIAAPASEPLYDPARDLWHRAGRSAESLRRARSDRADGRRLANSTNSRRSTARRWSPASPQIHGIRSASSPITASCSRESALKGAHFIELCCAARHSADFSAEHLRLHGRPQIRGRRHRQGRRQDGHRRCLRAGAQDHHASSAARSAPAITACAGALTRRAFC